MKNCDDVEQMVESENCDKERVSQSLIDSRIVDTEYQTVLFCGVKMMFCGIKMDNGFVCVGKPAACINPENWRDSIGKKIAYDNAYDALWALEGYRKMAELMEK